MAMSSQKLAGWGADSAGLRDEHLLGPVQWPGHPGAGAAPRVSAQITAAPARTARPCTPPPGLSPRGEGPLPPGQLAGQQCALGKMALAVLIGISFLWEVILPLQIESQGWRIGFFLHCQCVAGGERSHRVGSACHFLLISAPAHPPTPSASFQTIWCPWGPLVSSEQGLTPKSERDVALEQLTP